MERAEMGGHREGLWIILVNDPKKPKKKSKNGKKIKNVIFKG
jgi:hypothetical protein